MTSPPSTGQVRLADLARATGLSAAAVSLALRGKAGIPAATRERVLEAARRLGYVANPAAALLARQRAARPGHGRVAIAHFMDFSIDASIFLSCCADLGITGHVYPRSALCRSKSLSREMWSKGIQGLVLPAAADDWSEEEQLRFDWNRFSVVKQGRSLPRLPFHLIRHSAFDYMTLALTKVFASGYRKVAVLMTASGSKDDDDARMGAYLVFRERRLDPGQRLAWLDTGNQHVERIGPEIHAALRREQPDAILAYHWSMYYPLIQAGWKIPEHAGLASILADPEPVANTPAIAGCDSLGREHHRRALEILLDLVGRGERGFPSNPMQHIVEPVWFEGRTLPGPLGSRPVAAGRRKAAQRNTRR